MYCQMLAVVVFALLSLGVQAIECEEGYFAVADGTPRCERCPAAGIPGVFLWLETVQEGCPQCPLAMVSAGGATCRFSPTPMLFLMTLNFVGAAALAQLDVVRPKSDHGCEEVPYCAWFAAMLPVHLLLRFVFIMQACGATLWETYNSRTWSPTCGLCAWRASVYNDAPSFKRSETEMGQSMTVGSTVSFVRQMDIQVCDGRVDVPVLALASGTFAEALSLLVFVGIVPLVGYHWVWALIVLFLWLLLSVCNPYFSPLLAIASRGHESGSLRWSAPSVFRRGRWGLLFAHYSLGIHPKVPDFEAARQAGCDAAFSAAMYDLALPWMGKVDAVVELRRSLALVLEMARRGAGEDGFEAGYLAQGLQDRLSPLSMLLAGVGNVLSWQKDWRPAVMVAGGEVMEALNLYGVSPTIGVLAEAVREIAGVEDPADESYGSEERLPASVLPPILRVAAKRDLIDELIEILTWDQVWGLLCLRGASEVMHMMAAHGLRPSTQVVQEACQAAFAPKLYEERVPFDALELLLPLVKDDDKPLKGLGPNFPWEDGWQPIVMDGRRNLIELVLKHGAVFSRDVLEAAICEGAGAEGLEPLLSASLASGMTRGVGEGLSWEDFWRPLVLGGRVQRLQLLCGYDVVPTMEVAEAAIRQLPDVAVLSPILDACESSHRRRFEVGSVGTGGGSPSAKGMRFLAGIGRRLELEEVWRPLAERSEHVQLLELLARHGIVPTESVAQVAIRSDLCNPALARLLAAASRGICIGGRNGLSSLRDAHGWEDTWRTPVMRNDVRRIQLLCRFGLHPSHAVAEAAVCEHAPLDSLSMLLSTTSSSAPQSCAGTPTTPKKLPRFGRATSGGSATPLQLSRETWRRVAAREGSDVCAATLAVMGSVLEEPPCEVVVEAFEKRLNPVVTELLAGAIQNRVVLPRRLWLDLISATAPVEAGASALADAGEADGIAGGARPTRADALLLAAFRTCAAPTDSIDAAELWECAVDCRSASTARLLREHGIAPAATPREPPPVHPALGRPAPEGCEAVVKELYSFLEDGTAVVVHVPRQLDELDAAMLLEVDDAAAAALAPGDVPKLCYSEGTDTVGDGTVGDEAEEIVQPPPATLADVAAAAGKREWRTAGDLLAEVVRGGSRISHCKVVAQGQEELLHELVQCREVRDHLDRTVQADRDLALEPAPEPDALTDVARLDRARSLRGVATRLLGRAALRAQGLRPRAPRMPPAQPLPELHDLEACGPLRALGAPSGLATYDGVWCSARTGEVMCEIVEGVLVWSDRYEQPMGPLRIGPGGELVMELDGAMYTAVLEDGSEDVLLWSDGDVWTRWE